MQRTKHQPTSDRALFESIFEQHKRGVLGYAMRRTDDPADAADVLAEVFLIAWRRLDAMPRGDAARWWLFATARHVIANQRRGERRRDALSERLASELEHCESAREHEVTVDLTAHVESALGALESIDRELILLNVWEGLKPVEIARVLAMNPATVRVRLHRVRKRLAAELKGSSSETETKSIRDRIEPVPLETKESHEAPTR